MRRIDIRPYDGTLYFTTDRKEFLHQRAKYLSESIDIEGDAGITSSSDSMNYVVGVFNGTYDTLAHELSHVIIRLFGHVGMSITDETSEAFCYLLSDLMKECYIEIDNIKANEKTTGGSTTVSGEVQPDSEPNSDIGGHEDQHTEVCSHEGGE